MVGPNPKLSPSASAFPTPKASAKVLVPAKAEGPENEDGNGKSTSMSPGDVLGLGSYASDDDEDDNNTVHPQPSTRKLASSLRVLLLAHPLALAQVVDTIQQQSLLLMFMGFLEFLNALKR